LRVAISGRTRVFTILAHPSVNVTAPLIYNHIFSRMGLDMVYISHDVHPGAIADTVRSFSGWVNLGGFNVTIPHKESVAALVDDLCGVSMKTGTVNTVVRHGNGSLSGYNTDGIGALGALGETRDAVCLVIGAGGAARAIVHALLEGGARKVSILNRSPYRTQQLCGMFGTGPVHEYQGEPLEEVDVVVQATPVSERVPFDLELERFGKDTRILETVMRTTALSEKAESLGLQIVPGHAMLYYQTKRNFELFTGIALPPRDLDEAFASVGYHRT